MYVEGKLSLMLGLRPVDGVDVDALLHHLPQRAHLAEPVDGADDVLDDEVDLGLSGEAAETETKGRMCHILGGTERAQDV